MKKILVICDYYLPSVNSGGGMWTVVNIVDRFSDRYEFSVLTRNYDSPGDTTPYKTVSTNEWNTLGKTHVYYASNEMLTAEKIAQLVTDVGPDCVFLNSVFGTPVIRFLTARRRKLVGNIPVVISPTGNLGTGGMAHKWFKKKAFLTLAKITHLYRGVIWKPSTQIELSEVQSVFGGQIRGMIAPDLTPKTLVPDYSFERKPKKESGSVRFIFLSRIVRKKNLGFLLECMTELTDGNIILDIVGPPEDSGYWRECQAQIKRLPPNIKVNVVGGVTYLKGLDMLLGSHFFLLPTKNENFGYVFIESLAVGSPIMISDQTVWGNVENENSGWVIPLIEKARWIDTLRKCVEMGSEEYSAMAIASRSYAEAWLADTSLEDETARVFEKAIKEATGK